MVGPGLKPRPFFLRESMLPDFLDLIPYMAALLFVVAFVKRPAMTRVSPIQNGLGVCLVVLLILDPPDRWAGYGIEGPSPAMIFLILLSLTLVFIRIGQANRILPDNQN